jgi:hypothetical protein
MIEVIIGKPLSVDAPKNTYRFTLEVMFGDADGEDTNSYDSANPEDFVEVIQSLEKYAALGWNAQCDIQSSSSWAKMLGFDVEPHWQSEEPADAAFHTLMDLIPGDPGSDYQYQGSPQNWWISYFDEFGAEHECTFTIDGNAVQGRRH